MTDTLKPCPFCGGEEVGLETNYPMDQPTPTYQIGCYLCAIRTMEYDEPEEATKRWNTRADADEITRLRQTMRIINQWVSDADPTASSGAELCLYKVLQQTKAVLNPEGGE